MLVYGDSVKYESSGFKLNQSYSHILSKVASVFKVPALTGFRRCLGVQTDHSRTGWGPNRSGSAEHIMQVFIRIQRFSMSPECICSEVEKTWKWSFSVAPNASA